VKINIQELLWPNICPFCGKVSAEGACSVCRKKTDSLLVQEPKCMKCGKPVRRLEQEYCHDCMHTQHYYDRGLSLWVHREPVSTSIYQFKFHNQRCFASYYADEAKRHTALIRRWKPEFIIPVPLHSKRRRKRGYNQAEILAEELGRVYGIPVFPDAVRRIKATKPQKTLDDKKRRKNLEGAFVPAPNLRKSRSVLVVDDIYTTGSTIDAVAKVLKLNGIQKVYFLTISIGQGY